MLFNSFEFLVFLPLVFTIYWALPKKKNTQNAWLLLASYVFYGWWDWRFLFLILASSVTDYLVGLAIDASDNQANKKRLLAVSLIVNLGMLGFFKYYDFFVQELVAALHITTLNPNFSALNIIVPVGISFYTFQTMAYSIDIYRGTLKAQKNLIQYLTFVSFFPQLVAGPIERGAGLMPQFTKPRFFNSTEANAGLRQILWGFLTKLVIADNLAPFVDGIFENYEHKSSLVLALGGAFFSIQIYADFSAYSNIAIGTAKLFGIKLSTNFRYPFFSRNISELWRRWHISLSAWCRDYIYKPLGGNRGTRSRQFINTFVTYSIIGMWHGSNWTFLAFGIVHGLYFGVYMLVNPSKETHIVAQHSLFPSLKEFGQMSITFILFVLASIIFRSNSIQDAWQYFGHLFDFNNLKSDGLSQLKIPLLWAFSLLSFEWFQRKSEHPFEMKEWHTAWRVVSYGISIVLILFFGQFDERSFIYFQF